MAGNSKGRISKPSKTKYWDSRHLERNKVKGLMIGRGMTEKEATTYWRNVRYKRIPSGYIQSYDRK